MTISSVSLKPHLLELKSFWNEPLFKLLDWSLFNLLSNPSSLHLDCKLFGKFWNFVCQGECCGNHCPKLRFSYWQVKWSQRPSRGTYPFWGGLPVYPSLRLRQHQVFFCLHFRITSPQTFLRLPTVMRQPVLSHSNWHQSGQPDYQTELELSPCLLGKVWRSKSYLWCSFAKDFGRLKEIQVIHHHLRFAKVDDQHQNWKQKSTQASSVSSFATVAVTTHLSPYQKYEGSTMQFVASQFHLSQSHWVILRFQSHRPSILYDFA